ncbi:MAG TPA: DNA polymerase III subunit alpha [Bellilinea sp.]|nr:DNA polymerase III subunit alpha [Bellilinea sp.]
MTSLYCVHSYYSLLEGVNSPAVLAARAAEMGLTELALTDHNLLTGAVEFALACRKVNIRPIFGLEVDVLTPESAQSAILLSRLTLLAESETGWSNLCRLSSLANLEDGRALSRSELAAHTDGLIWLTGGSRGIANLQLRNGQPGLARKSLQELNELAPKRLFARITGSLLLRLEEEYIADLAAQLDLPLILSPEVFYLDSTDVSLHRTVCAIRSTLPVTTINENHGYTKSGDFTDTKSLDTVAARYPQTAITTAEINQRCQFQMPFGVVRFPGIPLPPGQTPSQALREKAFQGAKRIYKKITAPIELRLEYELTIIEGLGYDPIFLIMEELLTFARKQGILFSSRGSAASSLVAHCLGITSPDPLRLSLYFERFLNPARTSPPDIDTDIDSRRRDEIIQHCFDTYGEERVAMVATINRFRPRSAAGDVAKALGFSPTEARKLSQDLPNAFFAGRGGPGGNSRESDVFSAISAQNPDQRHQEVFAQASRLLGVPRHLSVHPGGLVISPDQMTDLVPVMRSGGKGVIISQFDLESLAYLGLVKIDLLGIRGLTVLADVSAAIHSWSKADFKRPSEVLDKVPRTDQATGEIVSTGKTIGCFQIESPGMRSTLKLIHAVTPDDIMAALALYRPGPLRGGLRDAFIRRYNHEEAVNHLHPSLTTVLDETYGVILYQEQVLRIAHDIAGLTLAESDLLRRAMSHFDPGKQMQNLKQKFIHGTGELHQIDPNLAEQIWDMMAAFAGYGFPKAHAASYAQIAWNSAWCKTHYPAEFLSAVLANWGGYYSQRVYLMEARRLGFQPHPPHINFSNQESTVVYANRGPVLYLGLNQVRDLTGRTIQRILQQRPFQSLEDFLTRVDPRPGEARNLIRCGSLDGLGSIPGLILKLESGTRRPGQPSLFEVESSLSESDWPLAERAAAQQEILGVSVDVHPLDLYADQLRKTKAVSTVEALETSGTKVVVAGVRQSSRRSKTSSGEWMAFLTLEDFDGMLDVVIFPAVFRYTRKEVFAENRPLIVEGVMETDSEREDPFLRAERVHLLG